MISTHFQRVYELIKDNQTRLEFLRAAFLDNLVMSISLERLNTLHDSHVRPVSKFWMRYSNRCHDRNRAWQTNL